MRKKYKMLKKIFFNWVKIRLKERETLLMRMCMIRFYFQEFFSKTEKKNNNIGKLSTSLEGLGVRCGGTCL